MPQRERQRRKNREYDETWDIVYEAVAPDLQQLGLVRNKDMYQKHQSSFDFSKAYFHKIFREIMDCMVEQGKAHRIKVGQYEIIKPMKI